jgi:hypothetical protein
MNKGIAEWTGVELYGKKRYGEVGGIEGEVGKRLIQAVLSFFSAEMLIHKNSPLIRNESSQAVKPFRSGLLYLDGLCIAQGLSS